MRFAAAWTALMSVALALLVTGACASWFGGSLLAWLLAIPAMFLALHLVGLPVVLLCELGERVKLVRRAWRPLVDEVLVVALCVAAASWTFASGVALAAAGFFGLMYLLRLCLHRLWKPGEPEEVQA